MESRLASERSMVQMMELTNEVNTKQDEVSEAFGGGGSVVRYFTDSIRCCCWVRCIVWAPPCMQPALQPRSHLYRRCGWCTLLSDDVCR